jgi:hypothetical protein
MVLATRVQLSSISYTHCMPWYPLIYSLLPGKDQQIYTRLLTMLQRFVNNAIFHSDPRPCLRLRGSHQKRSVHSPGINIKGCLSIILNVSGETQRTQSFPASTSKAVCPLYSMYLEKRSVHSLSRHQHQRLFVNYTQCFWRNAQRHGLQIAYNKNDDIHLLVRRAAVLPLHPLNTIEDYWFNALEDIDSADTNIATLGFTDYITSYWVEENRHLWNYYATEGPRTTNHLKGWHGNSRT